VADPTDDPEIVRRPRAIRAHDAVLDWLERELVAGRLRAGDRLPAERELSTQLGISRAAVREAIRVLEALGTVAQGTGSGPEAGTILVATPAVALTRFLRLHVMLASIGTADVVRARIALERESARLAARHATQDDLDVMAAHVAEMGRPGLSAEEFSDHDTEFHVAIARATGNLLVCELTIALRTAMRPTLVDALTSSTDLPLVMGRLQAEHQGVYDAIEAQDPVTAARRIEHHIERFYAPEHTPRGGADDRRDATPAP
jgi:GntR family transcriptional regulator, transcriptional repressor for pyruvate dehydrogenase complex